MKPNIEPRNYSNLAFHPYNIFMLLLIGSISALFLGLTGAYLYTRFVQGFAPVQIPILFLVTTCILLASSLFINRAYRAYLDDQTEMYQRYLWFTLVLTLLFLGGQWLGWHTLLSHHLSLKSGQGAAYLYLLSIVHFVHVLAGLPFLIAFLVVAHRKMKEPLSVMIYFSDPEKRLKLRLIRLYWHFLDILWVFLVTILFINSLF
ncbi:MAG: cytochrome c oxidase subunit 3 [Saprospiraceae bacterium]|nr:cytochrome c oxidase subunit 3 [Saprospiraceae bacterium]MCB9319363.1 cytochrome c oxidase subunit 3 [Lewinellaceae bacterium]